MNNEVLNAVIDDYKTLYHIEKEKRKQQQQELERYKNIIDELEKFLIEWENKSWEDNGAFKDVYDYLQELKGSDS